jgi:hypothetical protein
MGFLMKNDVVTHSLALECYVLQLNGRANSTYQRFMDAVRAGIRLKDQFPQHDIKVRLAQVENST